MLNERPNVGVGCLVNLSLLAAECEVVIVVQEGLLLGHHCRDGQETGGSLNLKECEVVLGTGAGELGRSLGKAILKMSTRAPRGELGEF